jgi:hypothetical protein
VVRIVSRDSHLGEKLVDLAGQDALVPQTSEQLKLPLVRPVKHPHETCDHLREQFRKLAKLKQAGIGVVREVSLGQHAHAKELLIVLLEMGEIAEQGWHVEVSKQG